MSSTVRRGSVAAAAALLLGALPARAVAPVPWTPDIPAGCGISTGGIGGTLLAGVSPAALPAAVTAVRRAGGQVAGRLDRIGAIRVDARSAAAAPAVAAALRATPGVGWVEQENVVRASRSANDPLVKRQWGLSAVGAFGAWDRETGGRNPVTVAVLDTGVDLAHPDLAGRVTDGPNQLGGSSSQDDHGHGTHVSGIIAASTNNKRGVAGMSWGARILAVKVLNEKGEGSDCSVVNGWLDAVDLGAKVINMSLGGHAYCPVVYGLAVKYGADKNVVAIAAAGNDGDEGNPTEAPASCTGVTAVGALDSRGKVANFSGHKPYVALSAPGVSVLSTIIAPDTQAHVYAIASGTSMAAPFVAGLAALLLSAHPTWTPQQVTDRMTSTARDLGAKGRDEFYGFGRIDAAKALR